MNRFRETREKERRASDAALENKYAFDRNMPHTLQYDTYCWFVVWSMPFLATRRRAVETRHTHRHIGFPRIDHTNHICSDFLRVP